MRILLVAPRTPDTFWSFRHAMPFISKKASYPPLGLLTVAAMLPRTWELRLNDLNVTNLSDEQIQWADYVMISALLIHRESTKNVTQRCQALNRPVIGGGPLFTSGHESFPEISHFVLGEAEDLMPRLVDDMTARNVQRIYKADDRPDVSRTPIPRWDLIDFRDYATMAIQFCRGCPFNCEFCDVIVMNGRVPRTKPPSQVIRELEALRRAGWQRTVFLVDDNFVGNKRRVRELLLELVDWRRRTGTRMGFCTEASMDLAEHQDLLNLMVEAGFKRVFVGIETPNKENLRACQKFQNVRRDLLELVRTIQAAGLEVMGGFIVGFDGDRTDVFRRQFAFIQRAGVVTAMVGLLTALPGTRLYKRLAAEGRLLRESGGNNTDCNFVTKLGRDELASGYRRLMRKLYEPTTYYRRARILLQNLELHGPREHIGRQEIGAFLRSLWQLGVVHSGRRAYWSFLGHALLRHPRAFSFAVTLTIYGHHFRSIANSL
jgi:radical SAM superfamily enzyme YgiQ (UPF0313 family)